MGLRVEKDLRNEKIGFKIREHTIQRVPYLLVLGEKEVSSETVSVRLRDGQDLGVLTFDELVERIKEDTTLASSKTDATEEITH